MCNVPPPHDGPPPPPGEGLCGPRLELDIWRVITGWFPGIPAIVEVKPNAKLPKGYELD